MGFVFSRLSGATFTIFLSFILSYAMLIGLALWAPEILRVMQNAAKHVEFFLLRPQIPSEILVWLDLLIEEGALLLLFFTVIARLLIAIVEAMISAPFRK